MVEGMTSEGGDARLPVPHWSVDGRWHEEVEYASHLWQSVLERFLPHQRWFDGRGQGPFKARVSSLMPLDARLGLVLTVIEVRSEALGTRLYSLPIALFPEEQARELPERVTLLQLSGRDGRPRGALVDCSGTDVWGQWVLLNLQETSLHCIRSLRLQAQMQVIASGPDSGDGRLSSPALWAVPTHGQAATFVPFAGEQSNSSLLLDHQLVLKLYRRLQAGPNPELEVGERLRRLTVQALVPPLLGHLRLDSSLLGSFTLAILQGYVPHDGDGWGVASNAVGHAVTVPPPSTGWPAAPTPLELFAASNVELPPECAKLLGDFAQRVSQLGERTAELHLALRAELDEDGTSHAPAFPLERAEAQDVAEHAQQLAALVERTEALLGAERHGVDVDLRGELARLQPRLTALQFAPAPLEGSPLQRIHGDLHLGQVLDSVGTWVFVDFEGEPSAPLPRRRALRSPLEDVAGMLRSLDYCARAQSHRPSDAVQSTLLAWSDWSQALYLSGWLARGGRTLLGPLGAQDASTLLSWYLLRKALYELHYELGSRPAWATIPLGSLQRLLRD